MMKYLSIAAALVVVRAQQDCELTNYTPCMDQAKQFMELTCNPMKTTNPTGYNQCLCYQNVNRELCFKQCPNNATTIAEYNGNKPLTAATCNAAKLDPNALPKVAPWQTDMLNTGSTTGPTGVAPGSLPSPTKSSNSAIRKLDFFQSSTFLLCAVAAGFLL
ncbi:hypothetical protein BC833DRAFT_587121 [Globomyces pollinis-pini]|nr:hypothetical protein BC833DRAFT_587121 [Globomyces pollinis-pini]